MQKKKLKSPMAVEQENIKGNNGMNKTKITLTFDHFSMQRLLVSSTVKKCILRTLEAEGVPVGCEINVLITNDEAIRQINNATRNVDRSTDVLSFPMFDFEPGVHPDCWSDYLDPETRLCPLGDMVISLERAAAQADAFGHSLRREVGYLTIHSILHLLGYDHLDEGAQKKQMREREEYIASMIRGMQR